jgi:hypothetical protein
MSSRKHVDEAVIECARGAYYDLREQGYTAMDITDRPGLFHNEMANKKHRLEEVYGRIPSKETSRTWLNAYCSRWVESYNMWKIARLQPGNTDVGAWHSSNCSPASIATDPYDLKLRAQEAARLRELGRKQKNGRERAEKRAEKRATLPLDDPATAGSRGDNAETNDIVMAEENAQEPAEDPPDGAGDYEPPGDPDHDNDDSGSSGSSSGSDSGSSEPGDNSGPGDDEAPQRVCVDLGGFARYLRDIINDLKSEQDKHHKLKAKSRKLKAKSRKLKAKNLKLKARIVTDRSRARSELARKITDAVEGLRKECDQEE